MKTNKMDWSSLPNVCKIVVKSPVDSRPLPGGTPPYILADKEYEATIETEGRYGLLTIIDEDGNTMSSTTQDSSHFPAGHEWIFVRKVGE